VVASTDPARLPGHSTWYLLTNLPRPATRRAEDDPSLLTADAGIGSAWARRRFRFTSSVLSVRCASVLAIANPGRAGTRVQDGTIGDHRA
jgi:hypothetical protein